MLLLMLIQKWRHVGCQDLLWCSSRWQRKALIPSGKRGISTLLFTEKGCVKQTNTTLSSVVVYMLTISRLFFFPPQKALSKDPPLESTGQNLLWEYENTLGGITYHTQLQYKWSVLIDLHKLLFYRSWSENFRKELFLISCKCVQHNSLIVRTRLEHMILSTYYSSLSLKWGKSNSKPSCITSYLNKIWITEHMLFFKQLPSISVQLGFHLRGKQQLFPVEWAHHLKLLNTLQLPSLWKQISSYKQFHDFNNN